MLTKDVDTVALENKLDELLERGSRRKPTKESKVKQSLEPLAEKLALMVEKKFTYKEIAEGLQSVGMAASVETIRRQIISLLEDQAKNSKATQKRSNQNGPRRGHGKSNSEVGYALVDGPPSDDSNLGSGNQNVTVSEAIPTPPKIKPRKHAGLDDKC